MPFPLRIRLAWAIQKRILPELRSSQCAFYEALEPFLDARPIWADFGCGSQLVPKWLNPVHYLRYCKAADKARMAVGLDFDERGLRANQLLRKVRGDLQHLPFASGSLELASANMVVEHLDSPVEFLREVKRVLKPSGVFVLHTPNISSPLIALSRLFPTGLKRLLVRLLEGDRQDEDVFLTHYRLNSPPCIRKHAEANGLSVKEIRMVWTSPVTQMLGPLVIFELLAIRLLRSNAFAGLRPDIVAILQNPD